ncbi:peptidase inhibitor 16 [Clupea harengus]|uniref:Peptidase inhibitor 16 n=1 Tax=Clupea harengus TaxID=7950 RepID=A0A6P3WE91_CLUHA|nr:peptidase inhibitor 16 [Clupea harengus]
MFFTREEVFNAACVCACVCALLAVSSAQLTEDEQQVILEQHNLRRAQVDPAAVYMRKMSWDENLKIVAEGYAAKCRWDHNPELEDIGENLYVTNGPLDPVEAIHKWFKEHENYNYTSNECDEGEMCGHYTQVVWADSHKVGCAAHLCEEIEGISFGKAIILVCNYFPTGNYEGEKPYAEGEFCSRCPEDVPRCEDFLCVPEEHPSEEPDLTESWATETAPSPEPPGTAPPLPPSATPAEDSAPEDPPSASSSASPAGEGGAEGTPPVERRVEVDLSLEEVWMDVDLLLQAHTPRSSAPEAGGRGRSEVKTHKGTSSASGAWQRVGPGMLLLIGLGTCLLA